MSVLRLILYVKQPCANLQGTIRSHFSCNSHWTWRVNCCSTMFRATKSHPVADALDKEQAARLEESSEDSHSESDPTTSNQSVKSATSNSSTEPITRQETKAVNRSKILVYVALVLAAAAVGALTYVFMAREETATFHAEVSYPNDSCMFSL